MGGRDGSSRLRRWLAWHHLWQVLSLPCHRTPGGSAGHTPPTHQARPAPGETALQGQSPLVTAPACPQHRGASACGRTGFSAALGREPPAWHSSPRGYPAGEVPSGQPCPHGTG